MDKTKNILNERGQTHGDFNFVAITSNLLKESIRDNPNYKNLPVQVKESLDMILHKTSRIVNGNCYFNDHWQDIIGYSQLILNEIEKGTYNDKTRI